ncbi:MAG: DEAD/DEAH box helicase [Acidobacteriota bacterium]|nr:DEAD/DEAH box helicase [Acidobacteriota bacterium]
MTPTPVQAAALPPALEGKDVLATAQTGTGKTLAFLLPLIEKLLKKNTPGVSALVLLPTRELAMQVEEQYNSLRGRQLPPAALVVGGLSEGRQLQMLRKGARLVVATPGRLEDFLSRRLVQLSGVQTLVLDEADRMLDMGFLPAIRRIVSNTPKDRQTLCFSATFEGQVVHLVKDYMREPVRLNVGVTTKPAENVKLQAFEVTPDGKQKMLLRLLKEVDGRCLIFSRTKRGTEKIAKSLNRDGIEAAMIHGDRSQSQRTSALSGFQNGRCRVLVATDVAARGIHVQDIKHVINYDLPEVAENFIHRVGRTGRAGEMGLASTFFVKDQRTEIFQLERALGIKMERMREDGKVIESHNHNPRDARPRSTGTATHSHAAKPQHHAHKVQPQQKMMRLPGETLQVQLEG